MTKFFHQNWAPGLLILVSRITISLAFGGLTMAQWNEG